MYVLGIGLYLYLANQQDLIQNITINFNNKITLSPMYVNRQYRPILLKLNAFIYEIDELTPKTY